MIRTLAFAAMLAPLQDELIEMKWTVEKGDVFDLKWTYDNSYKTDRGRDSVAEVFDRRTVEAEVTAGEVDGQFPMTIKKASWMKGTHEWEATLTYVAGKPAKIEPKLKLDPKKPESQAIKKSMDQEVAAMKAAVETPHSLDATRKSDTVVLIGARSARTGGSIFDKTFLHSTLPTGSVRKDQVWKDPIESLGIPVNEIEVKHIDYKVAALGKAAVTVKGGFSAPISPSQVPGVTTVGSFTFAREYSFHPDGYLSAAKEEITYVRKTDAKDPTKQFYRENTNDAKKQALTIKKRAPKEEKKPEEKK
jgi:hypothetical protein